ncbi:MAG: hypothetical protein ONB46_16410 [candidate division KSB1 bacterium]|nr:hypothetical protein [candidate division KSB1 bacterium]MDZ7367259.1 hypothetical protein [candidate division KSB1 bacterium]MDZ7405902.1 hypothetical protein [candidate division KSB1 bacterium]
MVPQKPTRFNPRRVEKEQNRIQEKSSDGSSTKKGGGKGHGRRLFFLSKRLAAFAKELPDFRAEKENQ